MRVDPRYSAKLAVSLAAVYLIWGSTFLFTKVAVTHLPIALYAAVRFLTAGSLQALMARFFRREQWPRRLIDCPDGHPKSPTYGRFKFLHLTSSR